MLVGREIKESAIGKKKKGKAIRFSTRSPASPKVQGSTICWLCRATHFTFTVVLLKRPTGSSLLTICIYIINYGDMNGWR